MILCGEKMCQLVGGAEEHNTRKDKPEGGHIYRLSAYIHVVCDLAGPWENEMIAAMVVGLERTLLPPSYLGT